MNVASMYGIIGTSLNVPNIAYTTSKHGVVGMTRADAIAYAKEGIRINAMCPGSVALAPPPPPSHLFLICFLKRKPG